MHTTYTKSFNLYKSLNVTVFLISQIRKLKFTKTKKLDQDHRADKKLSFKPYL